LGAIDRLVARDSSARVRATSPFFTSCKQKDENSRKDAAQQQL
jgi:hypothetical protein